jgi:hypothetical protein
MTDYSTPGVYFEWKEPPWSLGQQRTDIAGFVGIAARGPLHRPVRVQNWSDFRNQFGGYVPEGYLAYAVEGFFANGGRVCWVVRVADPAWARPATLVLTTGGSSDLRLVASSEGIWAHRLSATVLPLSEGRFNLTLQLQEGELEIWRDLSLKEKNENGEDEERYVLKVLKGEEPGVPGSRLARAEIFQPDPSDSPVSLPVDQGMQIGWFRGGQNGLWTMGPEHLIGQGAPSDRPWGLAALERVPEVSIVAIPDIMPAPFYQPRQRPQRERCQDILDRPQPPTTPPGEEEGGCPGALQSAAYPPSHPLNWEDPDHPPLWTEEQVRLLQLALVSHCERLKDRVAILDARREHVDPQVVVDWRCNLDSSYAALYFPWLRVPDSLNLNGLLRDIPPSGHVAGIYARVEINAGSHKPPANEQLESVQDLTVRVEDVIHGYLNDQRVNVLRSYPGRGLRVMGARTMSSDSQYRYVNVRRLLISLRRTIEVNSQWLVFEPNSRDLWLEVDRVLRGLLDGMWQRGMLDGATVQEAYQVVCDATSNMPAETNAGRMIALVGVQPPLPAEFVIVRVGRTDGGLQVFESSEVNNAAVR